MDNLKKYGRQDKARTHTEARAIICCVCGRKPKKNKTGGNISVVSEKWETLVKRFVYKDYSVHNTAHPTALCVTCRLGLSDLDKVYS